MTGQGSREDDEGVQAPSPDWVPPHRAYLYYQSDSYLYFDRDWLTHAEALVRDFAEQDSRGRSEAFEIRSAGTDRTVAIAALGLVLSISPNSGQFRLETVADQAVGEGARPDTSSDDIEPGTDEPPDDRTIDVRERSDGEIISDLKGDVHEFLRRTEANEIPAGYADCVDWHRRLVEYLLAEQNAALADAIACGAAHVMARTHGVRSSFRRVVPDQLGYFSIVIPSRGRESSTSLIVPGGSELSATAVGPDGEKLFSLFVAPGVPLSDEGDRERWAKWLKEVVRENSSRLPYPKAELWELAKKDFKTMGRISKKVFKDLQRQNLPREWTRPGRPRKTPPKIGSK